MRPFGQQCSFRFCCILSSAKIFVRDGCACDRPKWTMFSLYIYLMLNSRTRKTYSKFLPRTERKYIFFVFLGVYSLILIIVWNGERVTAHVGERWKSTAHRLMFGVYIRHDSSSGVYLSIIFPNIFALFKRRESKNKIFLKQNKVDIRSVAQACPTAS